MSKLIENQKQEIYIRNKLGESMYSLAPIYEVSQQNIAQMLSSYKPQLQYVVYTWYHILNTDLSDYNGWSNYGKWMIQKIHCSQSQETLDLKNDKDYEAFDEFLPYWHKLYISKQMEDYTKLYYMEEVDSII